MKKYIPIILVAIFFCASFAVKIDLFSFNNQLSHEEYLCLQFVLFDPVLIVGGLVLFILPRMTIGWASTVFKIKKAPSTIEIILLQLFGVANVILSFINLKNNCFILW